MAASSTEQQTGEKRAAQQQQQQGGGGGGGSGGATNEFGAFEKLTEISSGGRVYKIVGKLGSGASSSVFEATYKSERVALKIIPNSPKYAGFLKTELLALEKLSAHPYIISLNYYGLDAGRSLWFLDLEFCQGGDALHRIQKGAMSEETTKIVAFRLFQAIAYAHSEGICHRDIKLENVLFRDTKCTQPILADWGMSATFNCYEPLKRDCGSLHYAAPEILSNQPYFGDQVDSFSAGVLVFALASSCFPFTGKTPRARLLDIIGRERLPFPRHLSAQFRDFCCGLVETDPRNRLTIVRALMHPWFDDPILSAELSGSGGNERVRDDTPPASPRSSRSSSTSSSSSSSSSSHSTTPHTPDPHTPSTSSPNSNEQDHHDKKKKKGGFHAVKNLFKRL